jgi:hypothetical protein
MKATRLLDSGTDLNRSTQDWYTQLAVAMVCSMAILSTAAVTAGS